ncbi:hypothetical protein [Streptomyces sp. NPDC051994]|uniref:hypothetical protein n=1 Tax=unclassified Streptomyces TaxID=2593676 RepID=UPI00342C5F79
METSNSHHYGPEAHGIDRTAQWWCEVTRRPGSSDAIACVYAPGSPSFQPLMTLTLPADDLDETESVGHHAIRIARPLARLVSNPGDAPAMEELKGLLSATGPLGDHSSGGWYRLLEWLPGAQATSDLEQLAPLDFIGNVIPDDLWTVSMVADFLGFTGASAHGSARKWLSRKKIESEGREPGRRGQSQYSARLVQAAKESSPGSGRRGAAREGGRFAGADGS